MTPRAQVQTIHERELGNDPIARADRFFTEHIGIHKLLVVDDAGPAARAFHDQRHRAHPARAARRSSSRRATQQFRLLCGASDHPRTRNSTGELDRDRIVAHVGGLVERGVDVVAVSTAHGHSARRRRHRAADSRDVSRSADHRRQRDQRRGRGVPRRLRRERHQDRPGPRLHLHHARRRRRRHPAAHRALRRRRAPRRNAASRILADGGITKSGDIVKALTLGACASSAAACSPAARKRRAQIMEINGKLYKQYRGMGSLAAMQAGSAARYGHRPRDAARKVAAEGVEALKEVSPAARYRARPARRRRAKRHGLPRRADAAGAARKSALHPRHRPPASARARRTTSWK